MPTHSQQHGIATRIAERLSIYHPNEITDYLTEAHHQADLQIGDAHTLALDHIARLTTALRELGVWPNRTPNHDCE